MIVKKALGAGLAGLLLLTAIADGRNINDTPGAHAGSMPRAGISIILRKGFLVLAAGQIGGMRGKQNFVLDTGTSPSILNARIARRMRLEVTSGTLVTVGRALQVEQTVLPELALGPLEVTSLRMNVMDLSQWEKDLGAEIAGLIGMDVLGRTNFRLDYEKGNCNLAGRRRKE